MIVAIDGTTLCDARGGSGAGIEHYTWSIVLSLARTFPEHRFVVSVPHVLPASRRADLVSYPNIRLLRPFVPRIPFLSRHVLMPLALHLFRPDILFVPGGMPPFGWFGKTILTVHDLTIFEHPEWFPETSRHSLSTRLWVPRALKHATRLVAVSHSTKRQIERLFPGLEVKGEVIYPGVEMPPLEPAAGGEKDIVLCLSTIEPRKNLEMACRAFDRFLDAHPERAAATELVLAGAQGWKTEAVEAVIEEINRRWLQRAGVAVIARVGSVNEQEKWSLLHRASVFLFPSWDEGFGLPVLEAMAAGTPVICSNRGALPEVGGDAVLLVEPDDIQTIALMLAQSLLLPEGVQYLRDAGRERAKSFSWEATARGIMDVLRSSVATGG